MAETPTMLSELREWCDERLNEYGDGPVRIPDQLEPRWRVDISSLEFEREKEPPGFVILADD